MERSIETIWKDGFLENDELVIPKLNNLYNKKSNHVIDRFKRMYDINLIAIVAFTFFLLPVSFIVEIPYMGILMFILFNVIVILNRKFRKKLTRIDKGQNSYQYLREFDNWLKELLSFNEKLNRYVYPYIFLTLFAGFWFGSIGGDIPGNKFVNRLIADFPDMYLLFGFPLFGIVGIILVLFLASFFGSRIGKWDFNLVYGRILKKTDELLMDMEELRK